MAFYGLLAGVLLATLTVLVGGVQAPAISAFVRRRFPEFAYDGQGCLLTGLALLAAFMLGMFTMYAVLEISK